MLPFNPEVRKQLLLPNPSVSGGTMCTHPGLRCSSQLSHVHRRAPQSTEPFCHFALTNPVFLAISTLSALHLATVFCSFKDFPDSPTQRAPFISGLCSAPHHSPLEHLLLLVAFTFPVSSHSFSRKVLESVLEH